MDISKDWCLTMAEAEGKAGDPDCTVPLKENCMTDDQIKHMVVRFLGWKLPTNFSPDAGITFKATFNEHTAHPSKHEPTGTNLFDATQADAMVRHMAKDLIEDISKLKAEHDRTSRNRDMWRGQVDRQAEKLTIFRAALTMVNEWHDAGENSLELMKVLTIVEWALSQDAAISRS